MIKVGDLVGDKETGGIVTDIVNLARKNGLEYTAIYITYTNSINKELFGRTVVIKVLSNYFRNITLKILANEVEKLIGKRRK